MFLRREINFKPFAGLLPAQLLFQAQKPDTLDFRISDCRRVQRFDQHVVGLPIQDNGIEIITLGGEAHVAGSISGHRVVRKRLGLEHVRSLR